VGREQLNIVETTKIGNVLGVWSNSHGRRPKCEEAAVLGLLVSRFQCIINASRSMLMSIVHA
jgi:hypothetical protein